MPHDMVSLRRAYDEAYAALEAFPPVGSEDDQAEFDRLAGVVTTAKRQLENAKALSGLKSETAIGSPESLGLETATGFLAKYAKLPASAHVVPAGSALSAAQTASFGDFLMAVKRASAPGGRVDSLLIEASTGANESAGEDGGFLVEKDIADGLLRRTFDVAMIGRRVRRIPISAKSNGMKIRALKDDSRATGSRWGGVRGYWADEGESITPSRPKFRTMDLQLKKLVGLMYATDEMLQDSTALAAIIQEAFPQEFAFLVDDAIFEGTGSHQPLGFMNAGCKVTVAKETGQAAATIVKENIDKMWSRLRGPSMANAEWWINQDCYPQLMSLHQVIGTGGVPVYLPPGGLSTSPYGTLLGRPVLPIEYCSTLGTEGDIVLCDPSQYTMIEKGSIQYATSIHVAFLTGEQAFRFIYRVDGQPVDDKPITPFKGTATRSTCITLATRA